MIHAYVNVAKRNSPLGRYLPESFIQDGNTVT